MQRFTPMDPKEVDMVIYHANCADGAAGAVCALLRGGGKVHLHPGKHVNVKDDPDALEVAQGKCLLLVDFVYEREFLLRLKQVTKKIYVLDHHRSAMEQLQDLEFCLFDMNRSGARMAWDYFFAGCEPPRFIKFIEDRDLWRWAVPGSREFTTAFYNTIASEPINFVQFFQLGADGVWRDNDLLVDKFLQDGKLIVEYVESVVQKTASGTRMIQFKSANDKSIVMVNETHYVSELGDKLAQTNDFVLLVSLDFQLGRDAVPLNVSLRSRGDLEKSNSARFAQQFGGGGHPAASGFRWAGSVTDLVARIKTLTL